MKKQLLLLAMMMLPMVATNIFAVEAEINGLWYELVSKTNEAKVVQYKDKNYYSGNIVIPETIEYEGATYIVTSIGEDAFHICWQLTSITIPNSVKRIGKSAFWECGGLTSVHITDLEAWCKITFDSFYSNPLYYSKHLFLNGAEIKDLVIPNSVTSIGNYAFLICRGLTSVTIHNSVTSIGEYAFYYCSGLTSAIIGNSVKSIGEKAFSNCSSLTSVTIGNSVTSIEMYAFEKCKDLTVITIPNSVTSIAKQAFYHCI